ncbi:acyltransferase domain-containing protein, partial [Streptomyces europaeiscabiei]
GEWIDSAQTDAGYWYRNLRQTVCLEPAVRRLLAEGHGAFLEMSPHPVLTVPVTETVEAAGADAVVVGSLRRGEGGLER